MELNARVDLINDTDLEIEDRVKEMHCSVSVHVREKTHSRLDNCRCEI